MNYVIIELDTSAPTLEIFAPRYTTRDTVNNIIIKANEQIGKMEKLYVVDSTGVSRNLDFSLSFDQLNGTVKFNDLSIGKATLHVQVSDTVFNLSELYTYEIEIKESLSFMKVKGRIEELIPITTVATANIKTKIELMKIQTSIR